jgi:hypothetical protein
VRHSGLRVSVTVLVVSVLGCVAPSAAGSAHAQASATASATAPDSSAAPRVVPETGMDDNPIGVTFQTLSSNASGAIRIDNVPAAGTATPGNLNYAVISRSDRSVVSSGNVTRDVAGVTQLLAMARQLGVSRANIMVVSGTAGVDSGAIPAFNSLALLLGVADPGLTGPLLQALTAQSAPFSLLGIPAGASGSAWLNVGLVTADIPPAPPYTLPSKGDIIGRLQWNITTNQYDYTSQEFPQFDTNVVQGGVATNVMTFNGGDYPAGDTAGTSGFHVLVVDSVTLRVLANQTLPTNGGSTPVASLQEAFATQLAADAHMPGFQQFYANKQPPVVLLQSYGHPVGSAQAWQNAANTVAELGGNRLVFLALNPSSDYSLVGRLGARSSAVDASTILGQPGPLAGVLTRTRNMTFEPAEAGPANGVNLQMLALAYQPPDPFKAFTGGDLAAEAWIGVQLHLCTSLTDCNVRQAYWSDYRDRWNTKEGVLELLQFPQGQSQFNLAQFQDVQRELRLEFLYVDNVQSYFDTLSAVFYAAKGDSIVSIMKIAEDVINAVKPPSTEKTVYTLSLISKILAVGAFAGPPISPITSGLSAAFALGSYLVSQSGVSALPEQLRARTDLLGQDLSTHLSAAADSFDNIGRMIVSDAGKLTDFQGLYLTPAWRLGASSRPAKGAIDLAAQRWFATEFVPVAFPWLAIASGATPNNLRCAHVGLDEIFYNQPWRNQPALAQIRTIVKWENDKPVTQSVFFSKFPNLLREDNGPPAGVIDSLFAQVPGSAAPLLNPYAFMTDANFGMTRNVVDDSFCSTRPQQP